MNSYQSAKRRLASLGYWLSLCLSGCGPTESTQTTTSSTRMDSAVTRVIDSVTAKTPDSTASHR